MIRILVTALALAVLCEPAWACKIRRRAVICLPSSTAPHMPKADDKVMLRAKLEKGLVFFQEIQTETEQTMKVQGQELKQAQAQTFVLRWEVLGQDQRGQWQLASKIVGVKMEIDVGGNKIEYDSMADPAPNPLSDFFRRLMELELRYTLDSEFQVVTVEGAEKFTEKVGRANPRTKGLLEKLLNESALKTMVAGLFEPLPNQAVRPGDTWVRRSTLVDLGPIGTYQLVMICRYEGRRGELDKIGVKTEILFKGPGDSAGQPFKIKAADLKSHPGEGEVFFDRRQGRIVSSTLSHRLQGQMIIEVGGMGTVVDLDQRQTTRLRITDRNPLRKGK